jgi:ABC-2 type transport system permease protein
MLMEVKKSIKLIMFYFKFNLSSVMEYRVSFLVQTFGMILNNSAFIFFWWILFTNVRSIGGYGFKDVMMLWSIMSTGFGISFVAFGNLSNITRMILNGELDTYLLQPKDPLSNIICSKTVVSAWGDTMYGLILFIVLNGIHIKSLFLFITFSITAALIFASVLVTCHSISFYAGNVDSLAGLITEFMISFSIYPEGIFNGVIKYVLYTAIPTVFMVYMPVEIIAKFSIGKTAIVIVVTVLWIIIAYTTFYRGLKKYESGNLIINKL